MKTYPICPGPDMFQVQKSCTFVRSYLHGIINSVNEFQLVIGASTDIKPVDDLTTGDTITDPSQSP